MNEKVSFNKGDQHSNLSEENLNKFPSRKFEHEAITLDPTESEL